MDDDNKASIYEAVFCEANAGIAVLFSIIAAGVALALAAFGDMTGSFVAIGLSAWLAQIARSNFRRADSLYARAVRAELAEGGDAAELAEAA